MDEIERWAAGLPEAVAAVCARWSLTPGAPFEPGGSTAWVAPVRGADGGVAVLKLVRRHFEAEHEAAGLRVWAGNGAVRLLDHCRVDERTDALLLEACQPGTPATVLSPDEQDTLVCRMLRRLSIAAPADGPFRSLAQMCDTWADGVDGTQAATLLGDPGLLRAGTELFRVLARDFPDPPVLLSTDLHAGNVLASQREPWLAIDPKPFVGDRTYDLTQHMINCDERLAAEPRPFVRRMAALADVSPERLRQWLFARCVVECDEQPWLAELARRLHRAGAPQVT